MKLNKVLVMGIVGILLVCLFTIKKDNKQREEYVLKDRIEVNDSYNSIAMYQVDGEEEKKIDKMPEGNYTIDETKSYCVLKGEKNPDEDAILKTNENGEHIISNLAPEERCFVYFNKIAKAGDTIIENSNLIEDNGPHFDKTSCAVGCDVQENGLYKAEDDFGDSYYFRGTVNDNWVKFGNMSTSGADIWWRIIRINGDGTIRLIYAGNGPSGTNLAESDGRIDGTDYKFNTSNNNNRFVGYQYGNEGEQRGHTNSSDAYTKLKSWFEMNLKDEFEEQNSKIDKNAGFCGDRSSSTSYTIPWSESEMTETGGTGSTPTYYGTYLRLVQNRQPTLKCSTKNIQSNNKNNDYFTYAGATGIDSTTNGTITGTKSLDYPIGLITADEVAFAGGVSGKLNSGYWLYTGQTYWTMSPAYFSSYYSNVDVFYVNDGGYFDCNHSVSYTFGLRPVINLKTDTTFSFEKADEPKGTSTNPYIVSN